MDTTVSIDFNVNTKQALESIRQVKAEMENVAREATKTINNANGQKIDTMIETDVDNTSMDTAFNTIQSYFGLNTVKAIVNVAVDAAKINYDMLNAKILAKMNNEEFKDYKVNIKLLSNNTGIDLGELSNAANDAFSNDVAKNEIGEIMDLASKLSIANDSTVEYAQNTLTSLKNSLKLETRQLSQVADYITKANNDVGKVDVEALANGLKRNAPYLTSGKIKLTEYLGMGEVFTSQAIGQEETQTLIANYLSTVDSASKETKKWAKEVLGLDFSMRNLQKNGVEDFTRQIMEKTGGNTDYIANLFKNVRGRSAYATLSESIDNYHKALDGLKGSKGNLDNIFKTKMNDPYKQWEISLQKFKNSMLSLGEKLLPILTVITNAIGGVADALNLLPAPVVQVVGAAVMFISTFAVLNGITNILKTTLSSLPSFFSLLPKVVNNASNIFGAFGKQLIGTVGYILLVAYAIWFLVDNFNVAGNAIGSVMMMIVSIVTFAFGGILKAVDTLVTAISNAFIGLVNGLGGIVNAIGNALGQDGWGWSFDGLKQTFIGDAADAIWDASNVSAKIGKEMGDLAEKNYAKEGLNFNPFAKKANDDLENALEEGTYKNDIGKEFVDTGNVADKTGEKAKKAGKKAKDGLKDTTDAVIDNRKSWDNLKDSIEQTADSFDDISAKFEQMTYKVINATDLLKSAQYNLEVTSQWSKVRDNLLNNSNLSGYALNYISGLDASNIGELKALASLSNKDLSSWNSTINSINKINTNQAGKTEIINNNYTINRVANEKEIVDYIYKQGKKQGFAK